MVIVWDVVFFPTMALFVFRIYRMFEFPPKVYGLISTEFYGENDYVFSLQQSTEQYSD